MESDYRFALRTFHAPGRINLIGEHTDYNGGFAMPAAINRHTNVSVSRRKDRRISATARNFAETTDFELGGCQAQPNLHWSNYIRAVAFVLESAGFRLQGSDLVVESDLPIGAGLSSSAALEVSTALALLAHLETEISKRDLALLCQRAENEYVGVRCGIMDQLATCMGRKGHALLLDCRTLEIEYVPIPPKVSLVVCNSMVKHSLASGEYNRRREECEKAAKILSQSNGHIQQLRDATMADLDPLGLLADSTLFRRARHVISENHRTLAGATALQSGDVRTLGELMLASHESLRDDFQVSCQELDLLVHIAMTVPGVYGSRMMGGGFGGCTITAVDQEHIEAFIETISRDYLSHTGVQCETYILEASEGAGERIA